MKAPPDTKSEHLGIVFTAETSTGFEIFQICDGAVRVPRDRDDGPIFSGGYATEEDAERAILETEDAKAGEYVVLRAVYKRTEVTHTDPPKRRR